MSRASRIRTAQANVKLRFGSEDDALTAAIRQAYENRHASSSAARTQSQGVINAVRETIPAAKRIYRDQAAQQQTAADVYGRDVAGLGGVAASIQAGAALERQNATDQLAQSRSGTLTGLTQQSVAAKSGRQFALQQARSQFVKDIHDVLSQKRSLSEKEGAFLTSELARLTQAQADRALKRGTLNETIRHDKVGETTAQQKADQTAADKNKPKYITPIQQGAVQDGIKLAINDIKRLQGASSGLTRDQIEQVLLVGDPQSGIKAVKPLLASTALDVVFKGHIGHKNVKELRKRRVRVHKLGYKTRAKQQQFLPNSGQTVSVGGLDISI